MKIVRLSPFEQMDSLRRQIDRVFDDIDRAGYENYSTWTPAIELLDDSNNLILRVQLAGLDGNDIDIQVTRSSVTISGERHRLEAKSSRYLHSEFNYGKFQRQISLPVPIVNSEATANYEAGMLTLTLPKAEEAKQRVVKVSLGDEARANNSLPETEAIVEEAAANA
ncbi:Hsp20/alpha crystallin family protein [Myxosarcina sp. GI1]|uniref:Hsp20/alpha crystallin family protein n=1 Tax=Myxosarcina sp. GI1 TaxID=1541065 RepID=UPI00055FF9C1|nr:Hsp20/alpha crystallin family protein [Myxosarcina sp. GI1]